MVVPHRIGRAAAARRNPAPPGGRRARFPRPAPPRRAIRNGRARSPRRNGRRPGRTGSRTRSMPRGRADGSSSAAARNECAQARHDSRVDHRRPALAPVLPGKKSIPFAKAGARRGGGFGSPNAGQGQIADRDHMRVAAAGAAVTAAITERVELLDIAERRPGLFGDPGAQADLEGAMGDRIERARRQARARRLPPIRRPRARHQDQRRVVGTATIAAVRPISTGSAGWRRRVHARSNAKDFALETIGAASDRFDRRDHPSFAATGSSRQARRDADSARPWARAGAGSGRSRFRARR